MNIRKLFGIAMLISIVVAVYFAASFALNAITGFVPSEYNKLVLTDSSGKIVSSEIRFIDPNIIEVIPDEGPVEKIVFYGAETNKEVKVGLDDVPREKISEARFVRMYAIDPTQMKFDNASVTVIALSDELWKCKEWNFSEQKCYGSWNKLMNIAPGEEYTFTLTAEDPAFGEILQPNALEGIDTFVNQNAPNTNYGNQTFLVAAESAGSYAGILIKFNVSSIPSYADITSSKLKLYFYTSPTNATNEINISTRLITSNSWNESNVTWNTRPSYSTQYSDKKALTNNYGWIEFNVTEIVERWINGSNPNYGITIVPDTASVNTEKRFYSSDSSNTTLRTVLEINYSTTSEPNITIVWPFNNSQHGDGRIIIAYNVTAETSIYDCKLQNGSVISTDNSVTRGALQLFTRTINQEGEQNFYINCTDITGHSAISDIIKIYVNASKADIYSKVQDANNSAVDVNITFYQNSQAKYMSNGTLHSLTVDDGRYNISITPNNNIIKSMDFKNVAINQGLVKIIDIDDPLDNKGYVELYAINPSELNFTDATVTLTAKGDSLYKCKDWNFTQQECYGNWTFLQFIEPGQNYTITLTPDDPGFGEYVNSTLTSAVHTGSDVTSQVISKDGTFYYADIKDSTKRLYLNFSLNLTNQTILKMFAKKSDGVTVGIYAQSDTSGTNPLGNFTVTNTTGDWYNVTLNIATPTNAIWLGEGTGSGTDPKEYFDYIYAEVIDSTAPTINSIVVGPNPILEGNNLTTTAIISDNGQVNSALINIEGINYSMTQLTYSSNVSKILRPNRAGTYETNQRSDYVNAFDNLDSTYTVIKGDLLNVKTSGFGVSNATIRTVTLNVKEQLKKGSGNASMHWAFNSSLQGLQHNFTPSSLATQTFNITNERNWTLSDFDNLEIHVQRVSGDVETQIHEAWFEVNYTINTTIGWSYTFNTANLSSGLHNITVYANDTAGNNASSQSNFTVSVGLALINDTIADANNALINATLEVYDENNTLEYNETYSTSHITSVKKGQSKIKINPNNHKIKEIWFNNLSISQDIGKIINIDDPANNSNFNELYALDTALNFTDANVTITAANNSGMLYKCANWNFTSQNCTDGNWNIVMAINPGENYTFILTPGDPGYGEGDPVVISYCASIECKTKAGTAACTCAQVNTSDNVYATGALMDCKDSNCYVNSTHKLNIPDSARILSAEAIIEWGLQNGGNVSISVYKNSTGTLYLVNNTNYGANVAQAQFRYNLSQWINTTGDARESRILYYVADTGPDPKLNYDMVWVNISYIADDPPVTTLISPSNGNVSASNNINFSCNATDDIQLKNITFYWNYSGTWQANGTASINGTFNQTSFYRTNLNNGAILWNCRACDNLSQCSFASSNWTLISVDTMPPASITNLANKSAGTTWIYWNWTNPADPDFNSSIIYLNDVNIANISVNYYNATNLLSGVNYTLRINTKDNIENINYTNVSSSAKTVSIPVTIINESSSNSTGATLNTTLVLIADNGTTVYNSTDLNHTSTTIQSGYYTVIVQPVNHSVYQVIMTQAYIGGNTTKIVDFDSFVIPNTSKAFAINPYINFTTADITLTAAGTDLYKCINWNFTAQNCTDSNWIKILDVVPGQNYTFAINSTDPGFMEVNYTKYYFHNESDSQYTSYMQMKTNSTDLASISSEAAILTNNLVTCWNATWIAPNWTVRTLVNGTWSFSIYTNCSANFAANQYYLSANITKINSTGNFTVNTSLAGFACASGAATVKVWNYTLSNSTVYDLAAGDRIGTRICVRVTGGGAANKYGWMHWENTTMSNVIIPVAQYDSIPPSINFTAPTETSGSFLSRRYVLANVTASDADSGLKNITIRLYNSTGSLINSTNSTSSQLFVNFSVSADGAYYFNATANDNAGNINSTETRNVTIDTTAPYLNFTYPTPNNGTIQNQNSIFINISSNEILSSAVLEWNNVNESMSGSGTNWYKNKTNLAAGAYNFKVYGNDTVGNWNYTGLRTVFVNGAPSINLHYPENNSQFIDIQTITFNFTATDDLNLTLNCSIYLDNNLNKTNSTTKNGTVTNFTISGISYATHTWFVNCSDGIASNISEIRTFSITDVPPTFLTVNPVAGSQFNQTDSVLLKVNMSKNSTVTGNVSWDANSQSVNLIYNGTNWWYNSTFSNTLYPGSYTVNISATSIYGNINSTLTNLTVNDITNPYVAQVQPASVTYKGGTVVNISANATDYYYSNLAYVNANVSWDATSQLVNLTYNSGTGLFNGTFSNTAADGRYNITIIAVDNAGNTNNSEKGNFTIDAISPAFLSASPAAGSQYNQSQAVALKVNVSENSTLIANVSWDAALQSVNLIYNGSNWWYNGTFGSTFYPGNYNVNFSATDNVGNVNSTLSSFVVNDVAAPLIENVTPSAGITFNQSINLGISANVTDPYYNSISIVLANVTWNADSQLLDMAYNSTNKKYQTTFTGGSVGRYNVTIFANDTSGNSNSSATWFYINDSTPPTVINVNATKFNNTAETVTWTTDESSNSRVDYGLTTALESNASNASYVTSHSILLNNLSYGQRYYYNVTSCDVNGNCAREGTYNFTITDITPPEMTSHTIDKYAPIINETVFINASATDDLAISGIFANITLPNGTITRINLPGYFNATIAGRHNVTIFANDTSGNIAVPLYDYFIAGYNSTVQFNVVDSSLTGIANDLTIYLGGTNISIEKKNFTGQYLNYYAGLLYDLLFRAYNYSVEIKLMNVNITADNNKTLGIDKTTISGYVITYGINNTYNLSGANLTINYTGISYSDEDALSVEKCSDWSFTARGCNSGWTAISALQNKILHTFTFNTLSFSAFSIKETIPVSVPESERRGSGGTYVEVPCEEKWLCTDWDKCENEITRRSCSDIYSCGTEKEKPSEVGSCIAVYEKCFDNITNQDESDVDCGGGICKGCEIDQKCYSNRDCESDYCYGGKCKFKEEAAAPALEKPAPLSLLTWKNYLMLYGLLMIFLIYLLYKITPTVIGYAKRRPTEEVNVEIIGKAKPIRIVPEKLKEIDRSIGIIERKAVGVMREEIERPVKRVIRIVPEKIEKIGEGIREKMSAQKRWIGRTERKAAEVMREEVELPVKRMIRIVPQKLEEAEKKSLEIAKKTKTKIEEVARAARMPPRKVGEIIVEELKQVMKIVPERIGEIREGIREKISAQKRWVERTERKAVDVMKEEVERPVKKFIEVVPEKIEVIGEDIKERISAVPERIGEIKEGVIEFKKSTSKELKKAVKLFEEKPVKEKPLSLEEIAAQEESILKAAPKPSEELEKFEKPEEELEVPVPSKESLENIEIKERPKGKHEIVKKEMLNDMKDIFNN